MSYRSYMNLEISLFEALHSLAGKFPVLDWFVIFFGKYLPYLLVLLAIYLIWKEDGWRRRIYYFSLIALTAILSRGILTELIRFFHPRPRPFEVINFQPLFNHEAGGSFPSGHATFFFAVAFAIFIFNRKWGAIFTVAALLLSVTRVIAGVHWPLDIAAGVLLGLLSVFVVKWLLPRKLIT